MDTAIFLLLSGLTGVVEVGAVIYSVLYGYTAFQVLLLVLAYQIGCFFPTNIMLKKPEKVLLCCFSLLGACLYSYFMSYFMLVLTILFISPCLQMARSVQKSSVSTGVKRIFRIMGFAVSPFFSPVFMIAISAFVLVITVLKSGKGENVYD